MSFTLESELSGIDKQMVKQFKSDLLIALVKKFGPEVTVTAYEVDNVKGNVLVMEAVGDTFILKVEKLS